VADKLYRAGLYAPPFHGDAEPGRAHAGAGGFQGAALQVVVTTDLAARGIDIAQLPVVVNYDLPRSPTDYVHRIGRTGRAGESGLAVSFVSADTGGALAPDRKTPGHPVPREQVAGFEPQAAAPEATPTGSTTPGAPTGGIKGRRPSKKDKLRAAAAAAQQEKPP
jgi:ATP-dependent RNA helicase RhlE